MNAITTRNRLALASVASAAVLAGLASTAMAARPRACTLLTKTVAAALLHEQAKTLLDSPLVCSYRRASERAAEEKTSVSLTIVPQPSVAAAKKAQHTTENVAPKRAPAGFRGFKREALRVSGASAFFVYMYVPGKAGSQTITTALTFAQVGAAVAQFNFNVYSKGAPAFTVAEVRQQMTGVVTKLASGAR